MTYSACTVLIIPCGHDIGSGVKIPFAAAMGAAVIAFLASCSREKPVVRIETPAFIGVVDNVYARQNYVLVRLAGSPPPEGTVLISQSPQGEEQPRVANLVVTAERLGNLRVPADIRSGLARKGDLVFLYKNLEAPVAAEQQDEPLVDIVTPPLNPSPEVPPAPSPEVPGADAPVKPAVVSPEGKRQDQSIEDMLNNIPGTYEEAVR